VTSGSPLLAWRTLSFPAAWEALFDSNGPLTLEVGFGDGRFTERLALEQSGARFVGLEISSGSLQRALKRLKRSGVGNVRIAKVGAAFALRQLFAASSLDAIVVNFPDPWPKERHSKHRLLQRSFFALAAARLRSGGEVRLATDHAPYLEFARSEAAACGLYRELRPQPPAAVFETKYAVKWRDQGKPLYYVVFARNPLPAEEFDHLERPAEMPHALLKGSLPDLAPLPKTVLPYAGGHVILHDVSRLLGSGASDAARERWLVRATVEEPDLKQQLMVLVEQRSAAEVIVRLEPFGDPIITPVARGAVHAVTEWLLHAASLSAAARNY